MRIQASAAVVGLAALAALTGCGPTNEDRAVTASNKLVAAQAECEQAAWDQFPTYSDDPAREVSLAVCAETTCADYKATAGGLVSVTADEDQAAKAEEFAWGRYEAAGCAELDTRVQTTQAQR